ncbi:hypothetical protein FNV43_RR06213 [Rhamnella rubrinervis]|uniref:Beta-glucosidase n=1 Tax=Rhamnella rubrinervis TaxID=2594499 RepID=A0A8K0HE56_9ROSA|nr:hypothetical protein FNV43_RR06213 [Rhamnella rubrinervis]
MTKFLDSSFLLGLLALVLLASTSSFEAAVTPSHSSRPFNRTLFPPDFIFGAGSAAYQIEGAAYIDGKGPSNWDHYTKNHPGIMPFVTIFHWDVPQALEEEYGGFLKPQIVKDYEEYAEFVFKTFGDRVKNWCTLNEPTIFTLIGYDLGYNAPGRCSPYVGSCLGGDSATEPYLVAHHLLLAHAAAVKVYKQKYQASQKGKIGITLVTDWYKAKYNTQSSIEAASRALDFNIGWFLHPLTYGDYPKIMRSILGNRLPKFNTFESNSLIGSFDYLGLNYYTANYADALPPATANHSFYTHISTFFSYPRGLEELLIYIKDKYKNPPLYVTENGLGDPNTLSFDETIKDSLRIRYLHTHILHISKAMKEGANVKGYYIWTFLDDFEWANGYTKRFGIVYVDFKTLKRHLKFSAYWFKMFLLK